MDTAFVKISDIATMDFLSESPIETLLLKELEKFKVPCMPQVKIGPYRADICIDSKYRKIVVECDGKEFHKDKARDARRDNYMLQQGFMVIRFTGSEIVRSPKECAMKIIENISEIYSSPTYQHFLEEYLKKQMTQEEDPYEEISEENK